MRISVVGVFLLLLLIYWIIQIAACTSPIKVDDKPSNGSSKLAWNNSSWDQVLIDEITPKMAAFDSAKDIQDYCPKWKLLNDESKVIAVANLFVAIAKFESGYNPKSSMTESTGQDSIGLFQLSYGDHGCPKSKSEGDLTDPSINIKCAVKIASSLVADDKLIASGGYKKYGAKPSRGMARYWSVIRVPDSHREHHKKDIMALTSKSPGCI